MSMTAYALFVVVALAVVTFVLGEVAAAMTAAGGAL